MSFLSRLLKPLKSSNKKIKLPEDKLNKKQLTAINQAFTQAFQQSKTQQAAFDCCKHFSDQGSTQALYQLGLYYENGDGQKNYPQQACDTYWRAANKDHPEAQFNLALLYAQGSLDKIDLVTAHHWFTQAANLKLKQAQYNLANFYQEGLGCIEDKEKAFELYQQSAQQGYIPAWQNIAVMYYQGEGTSENKTEAYAWTLIAAKAGNAEAISSEPIMTDELNAEQILDGKHRLQELEKDLQAFIPATAPQQSNAVEAFDPTRKK